MAKPRFYKYVILQTADLLLKPAFAETINPSCLIQDDDDLNLSPTKDSLTILASLFSPHSSAHIKPFSSVSNG